MAGSDPGRISVFVEVVYLILSRFDSSPYTVFC